MLFDLKGNPLTTLADYRAQLRLDLFDPAGASQRFADADLDRAIQRALAEYQLAAPRAAGVQLTTTPGSRELSLAGLPDLLEVWTVEWPVGAWPRRRCDFRLSADRLVLELLVPDPPAGAEPVNIDYGARHTVDTSQSTVPPEHVSLLLRGAYGFACLACGTPAADNFRYQDGAAHAEVDDTGIIQRWHAAGHAALAEFRGALTDLRNRRAQTAAQRTVWAGV